MVERAFQLQSAAADVLEIFAEQANHALRGNLCSRFLDLLIVHQHLARKNKSLRPLARGGETAVHKEFVESNFQNYFAHELYHESASTRSSAKC